MQLNGLTDSGSMILTALMLMPTLGALMLFFVGKGGAAAARNVALAISGIAFIGSIHLLLQYDFAAAGMQFVERKSWLPQWGISYTLGIDGLSLWMIVLTTFLTFLVIAASTSVEKRVPAYLAAILVLETGMLGTFMALDAILFYVFWEVMLIPMYFLIGVWGGSRKIYAAIKFVLYTALGSLLMLIAIAYLGWQSMQELGAWSFYLGDWMRLGFGGSIRYWLFGAFALAFAIKIPLFPLHTWLPDAHVEAPTGGSVILAGILLKMGLYGLIRFAVPVFPDVAAASAPLFALLGVVGIVYGALVAWVQTDMKKLVAYSSVSHMGFCVLGFASGTLYGMQGCVLQMINHGISTGALFLLVGVLYDRKHTRMIADFGGIADKMPAFAFVFLIITLSSIGLPLTNGFVGEFLVLLGGYQYSPILGALSVSGVVLGAMYMLSLYRRVCFGPFDSAKNGDLQDLTLRERLVFAPLLAMVFVLGVYPQPFLRGLEPTSIATVAALKAGAERPIAKEWIVPPPFRLQQPSR